MRSLRQMFHRREGKGPGHNSTPAQQRAARHRRGSALILALVLTLAVAGLATSAIYLAGNAQILTTTADRERDLRYAAEATLAIGKSRLNYDPLAMPDTGYATIWTGQAVTGADGAAVPNVVTDLYVGPSSSNTGQFGRFASVVAVARGSGGGAAVVRRLELAQESFAKFAYWSNKETMANGTPIYFNNNDQLWGPVWSNDTIRIGSGGARFHGDLGTARIISGKPYGTFDMGYTENQRVVSLPSNTTLSALSGYASSGNLNFTAPTSTGIDQTKLRIEFVAKDLDGNGQVNGADEGFIRVYKATGGSAAWVRGDSTWDNCGAAYVFAANTKPMFVPLSEHQKPWVHRALDLAPGPYPVDNLTSGNATTMVKTVMSQPTARCYLGGDPNLRIVYLRGTTRYNTDTTASLTNATAAALDLAGTDTTFVASSALGTWLTWPGGVDARVQAKWPDEAAYLFPIFRGLNPGTKGVVYVSGTVGLSGTLRGRITVYATGNVAVLDDVKYVTDPALNLCSDILGVIAGQNVLVADNALQDPRWIKDIGWRNMDDTKDVFLQGVLMALNTAFGVENYASGPTDANDCETINNGRGCLYETGGIIQQNRGAVGLSNGSGFSKRYSYDRCALYNPPPYFPTTGRYTDNRYYEIDPVGFDVAALYRNLTPGP